MNDILIFRLSIVIIHLSVKFIPKLIVHFIITLQASSTGGAVKTALVQCYKTFFPFALITRPNKLEGLPLNTLSSQIFELRARQEQTQLEDLSDASFLGKLLLLSANVRLDWKVIAKYKHSSLFGLFMSNEEKKFYNIDTWCQCYKDFSFVADNEAK